MILPIVLYQGPPAWSGPRTFADQLGLPEPLRLALGRRFPDLEPALIELPSLDDPAKLRRVAPTPATRLALTLLRLARTDADLLAALQQLSADLAELWSQPGAGGLFRLIVTYTMTVRPELSREALVNVVKQAAGKEAGDVVLSLPARMLAEGRAEGRVEASRSILQDLLGARFGVLDQATIERVEQASIDELRTWIRRTPDATTLQSVFSPRS